MVYDELMKSVEAFSHEDMKDAAMKCLKKVPEKDWEQFDSTGFEVTGDLKHEFELVEKMVAFWRKNARERAVRVVRMTEDEIDEYEKEMREMRKRKRKKQS